MSTIRVDRSAAITQGECAREIAEQFTSFAHGFELLAQRMTDSRPRRFGGPVMRTRTDSAGREVEVTEWSESADMGAAMHWLRDHLLDGSLVRDLPKFPACPTLRAEVARLDLLPQAADLRCDFWRVMLRQRPALWNEIMPSAAANHSTEPPVVVSQVPPAAAKALQSVEWASRIWPDLMADDKMSDKQWKALHERLETGDCPAYEGLSVPAFETWNRYRREGVRISAQNPDAILTQ